MQKILLRSLIEEELEIFGYNDALRLSGDFITHVISIFLLPDN